MLGRRGQHSQAGRVSLRLERVHHLDPLRQIDRLADLTLASNDDLGPLTLGGESYLLAPAFFDLHAHLRYPGQPQKELPETARQAALQGGYARLVCMANTDPPVDRPALLQCVQGELDRRCAPVTCHQVGALTVGLEGRELTDLEGLVASGAVAISDDGNCAADEALVAAAMARLALLDVPLLEHSQLDSLAAGGVLSDGPYAAGLALPSVPKSAETELLRRDIALCQRTGCRVHFQHLSCAESVDMVAQAKAQGLPVTCEVNPHDLLLDESVAAERGTLAKVNPPLRGAGDRLALLEGLRSGVIDAVATDHAPHELESKMSGWLAASFGMTGLELCAPILLTLVERGEVTLARAIEALTTGPRRVVAASWRVDDMVLVDLSRQLTVDARHLASRGHNTPLEGFALLGKVLATWVGGRVSYFDGDLLTHG